MKKLITATTASILTLSTILLSGCGLEPVVEVAPRLKPASGESYNEFRTKNIVSDEFSNAISEFNEKTASLLYNNEGNINFSPTSLYLALSLAKLGGADDPGLVELLGIDSFKGVEYSYEKQGTSYELYVPEDENEALADQCQRLLNWVDLDRDYTKINIASSIWSEREIKLPFAELVSEKLYAEVYNSLDPKKMSDWIKKQTGGQLAPELETLEEQLLSILTTVSFEAQWTDKFQKSNNEKGSFHSPNGDVDAEFMQRTDIGSFRRGEDYTTASLGFKDGGSMTIVLPDEGTDIRALLKDKGLTELLEGGESKCGHIIWYFPKFEFDSDISFKELLTELGAGGIFDCNSGMAKNITDFEPMTIAGISQETTISVDERGVSAAAYTRIDYCGSPMPEDTADMHMDRPFLYAIEYQGALLFVGIVDDPNG